MSPSENSSDTSQITTADSQLRGFVILEHDFPFLHWDLMFEVDTALRTWRLLQPVVSKQWLSAESLPDHRLEYLDYEGPVSRNRGRVRQIARGFYSHRGDGFCADADLLLAACDMATRARGRDLLSAKPQWWFA